MTDSKLKLQEKHGASHQVFLQCLERAGLKSRNLLLTFFTSPTMFGSFSNIWGILGTIGFFPQFPGQITSDTPATRGIDLP